MKTASVSAPSTSSSESDPRPTRDEGLQRLAERTRRVGPAGSFPRTVAALAGGIVLVASVLLTAWVLAPDAFAGKKSDQIPRKVRMDVHWGDRRNREAYRLEMQRAVVTALTDRKSTRLNSSHLGISYAV